MERRTTDEELINQIGGKREKLSPAEEGDEVKAIKELGGRLGLTGFETSDEQSANREPRLKEARKLGQDPEMFFWAEVNRLDIDIKQLTKQLNDIEAEQLTVFPSAGEDFATAAERVAADQKARAEKVRSKLEQLNFDRSRTAETLKALGNKDTTLAGQDLEGRINRAEKELAGLDGQMAEAEQDKRYINLMAFSANASESARQAQEAGWEELAGVHKESANLYAKRAAELVGLDKLKTNKDSRSKDRKDYRAMVKNLELHRK